MNLEKEFAIEVVKRYYPQLKKQEESMMQMQIYITKEQSKKTNFCKKVCEVVLAIGVAICLGGIVSDMMSPTNPSDATLQFTQYPELIQY